jgi:hypothetical protein
VLCVTGKPEAVEVLGQKWRAFTTLHYAAFAVAGAVFLIGFMVNGELRLLIFIYFVIRP